MSSKKEKLKYSDKALKESLEDQLSNLKENFNGVGKNALYIGGGLVGVYALISLLTSGKKKKKSKKITIQQTEIVKPESILSEIEPKKQNLLSSTLKEQLIVFLLGVATQRLTQFLSELDKDASQDDSE